MTSKDLYFKLLWRDISSRAWLAIILLLMFMIRLPVRGLAVIEMNLLYLDEKIITKKQLMTEVVAWVSSSSVVLLFLIIIGAALCAFTGFAYLHSRKQLDVYHSIPIKRGKLLTIEYVGGLILFLVPFLAAHIFYIVICMSKGIYTGAAAVQILGEIAVECSVFLLVYHVAIAAIMLTGRLLVGIAAFVVITSYPYLVRQVVMGYVQCYFSTYYTNFVDNYVYVGRFPVFEDTGIKILPLLLAAVLLAVLTPWLYKRRPSEAAGRSIAFRKIEPWVKVLLMIPVTMGCGIFAREMSSFNQDGWMIVGIIFGLLASHCLIETIYSYDVKSVLSHKISFAAGCVGVVLLVAVFRFDLIGYDRYIPNKDNVAGMGIYIEQLGMKGYYGESFSPVNGLEDMHLESTPEAYQIIDKGIERAEQLRDLTDEEKFGEYTNFVYVRYKLKNGRTVMRQYMLPLTEIQKELQVLFEEDSFRDGIYPILKDGIKDVSEVILNDAVSEKPMKLSDNEITAIIEAYRQDAAQLTFEELTNVSPVGDLSFTVSEEWYSQTYPLYESFENTLAELKKDGYEVITEIDPEQVTEIELNNVEDDSYGPVENAEMAEGGIVKITDKKEIKKIIPQLVWDGSAGVATDNNVYAVVYMKSSDVYGRFYSIRAD